MGRMSQKLPSYLAHRRDAISVSVSASMESICMSVCSSARISGQVPKVMWQKNPHRQLVTPRRYK